MPKSPDAKRMVRPLTPAFMNSSSPRRMKSGLSWSSNSSYETEWTRGGFGVFSTLTIQSANS